MKTKTLFTSGLARTHVAACGLLAAPLLTTCPAHAGGTRVTRITYDAGDHVASVTGPRGLVTTYTHDGLGQLWQRTSPDTGTIQFTYDSYGRRASMTRADGVLTTYHYDAINRIVSITAGGQTHTFTYDTCTHGVGRLCTAHDASGTTAYAYTPQGWITQRRFTVNGTTWALGYDYDAMGHLTTLTWPDGNQATYTYTRGVVSKVTLSVGGTSMAGATAITYRPMDRAMTGWTASNGLSNTLQYDTDGRLTTIQVPGTQSLSFTYDDANRIIHIANGIDDKASESLGYDAMSQLRTVYSDIATVTYRYDAAGNRISHSVNGAVTTATYATGSNRLQHLGGATTATYSYDPQGNTTGISSGATYHYNAFNRLDSAAGTTYYVNPAGQRLRKHGPGGTTLFAPSNGGTLLAEKLNGVWVDYLWLNGRLIGRLHNGQVDAIHADQVGRPEVMTDANQDVIWWSDGKPFGRQVLITSTPPLNLGFPGQYHDAETGMWHNGFRDYDADTGRYLQSDPLGLIAGTNTYVYVGGNPLSRFDAMGLRCSFAQRALHAVKKFLAGHLNDTISFDAGDLWGVGASLTVTRTGDYVQLSGRFGVGVGMGFGVAVTSNYTAGHAHGLGIQLSGTGGVGRAAHASASATLHGLGGEAGIGFGGGGPGGASLTVGYSGNITKFRVDNSKREGSGCDCN